VTDGRARPPRRQGYDRRPTFREAAKAGAAEAVFKEPIEEAKRWGLRSINGGRDG
jgi:hypothetical protein